MTKVRIFLIIAFIVAQRNAYATIRQKDVAVIAYYSGNATDIEKYPIEKLTHIIYSFVHLRGSELYVSSAAGNILQKLVSLKKRNASLKVSVALGGWGGCKTCSPVFADARKRKTFAKSVKKIIDRYKIDGIDLDWEYPAVKGPEGHPYAASDKQHFTELVKELRTALGNHKEITFAAGGFPEYLEQSIEWKEVMAVVDRVHLMSYDLVNRLSPATGHHTPLYSTSEQVKSADHAVQFLGNLQIPSDKIVIGIAFYARVYQEVNNTNNGLYQPAKFRGFVTYKNNNRIFSKANGYENFWDDEAKAPYSYNAARKLFATYDNVRSARLKTQYAKDKHLGGVMFWELRQDNSSHDMLNAIYEVKMQ